jgi:DNA-binding transcriptional ArsR family regulator
MHEEEEEAARERRARSHSMRVAILAVLAREDHEDRELDVSQIRDELDGDLPLRNLYYHLRVLKACRLVEEDGGRYGLA